MRGRSLRIAVVVAAALAVGAVVAPSVADRIRHPRDVDAYQDYVVTYILHPGTQGDKEWAGAHSEQVLAEGDRACEWLSQRQSAPDIDPTGASEVHHLSNVYLADRRDETEFPLTREGHRTLVVGAWAYLCSSESDDKSAPISEFDD